MGDLLECKSPLSNQSNTQVDLDGTLTDSNTMSSINTEEPLLAEVTRLREENRLLREELNRLKSSRENMVSVATQTNPEDFKEDELVQQKKETLMFPLRPQRALSSLAKAQIIISSPVLPPAITPEEPPNKIEESKIVKEENKEVKRENKNIPVTFNTPLKYSKECSSLTLEFPKSATFEDIVEKYWSSVPIDLSKEIYYDQFKDLLLCEKCSVACSLIQIEPKALIPMFYTARRWNADTILAKKLASYYIQTCRFPNEIFNENGLFHNVLRTCLTVYCKSFIRNTLKIGYKTLTEHLSSHGSTASNEMNVKVPYALEKFVTVTLGGLSTLPENVLSIVHAFMRAAHTKFPELKQALFGAMAFRVIVCTALENPEKYDIYTGALSSEMEFIMKVVLKVFKSACCHQSGDEPPKNVDNEAEKDVDEEENEGFEIVGEADTKQKKEEEEEEELMTSLRNDIIINQSLIRSSFKKFVLKGDNNSNSLGGVCIDNDDYEWFSKREYEKHLRWLQALLRSYPDKFKKFLSIFIQIQVPEDIDTKETDDKIAFTETDTEIINNNMKINADSVNENVDEPIPEVPSIPIEDNTIFKEATRISFLQLHPRFDYHLKVNGTDHYISEDPAFTGHPLSEWPLVRLYWEGSLKLEFDFVDNKEFDDDQYVATQIARIAGTEYLWSLLSDEAYLFSQALYRAVPHVNREYPINRARVETTPFPPQLDPNFNVVVYLPDGTASKTCKCDLNTSTSELLSTISTKFFRDTKQMFKAEEIALKAVGKEQYLLHDDYRPVSSCSYIRDSLRKKQRPSFVIVDRAGLVLETPFDVAFDIIPPTPPDAVSSLSVLRPLEVFVSDATCLGQIRGHVVVECTVYHGGRKVSALSSTPFEVSSNDAGAFTWNNNLSLGMQIPTIPREALLCFGLYSVDDAGKRAPLAWTSCRIFDHAARLISGPHSLPLLAGEPNPIGICVHAMGLQTKVQLKVVFPNYEESRPIVHFTSLKDEAVIPVSRISESATSSNLIKNSLLSISDDSSKNANGNKGNRTRSFTSKIASITKTKNIQISRPGPSVSVSSSAPSSSLVRTVSDDDKARLETLIRKDPLYVLDPDEQRFVWSHREYLRKDPLSIIKIAQSVPWVIPAAVRTMHRLLNDWPLIDPVRALELLDSKYPDGRVREYAVRCIEQMGVDDLDDYIMQLVQALKCETYHRSPLALFLLKVAINNRLPLGHTLFLALKAELHIPEVRERFTLFLKCYLRASGMHRDVIIRQLDLTDALMMANKNKSFQNLEYFPFGGKFFLPHDPTLCVSKLIFEKCRVLSSARAPLWLAFENADKLSKEPICVLFKAADDLRQDMLALQVIKLMGKFWESDKLDMRLTPYKCVALGPAVGLIELVPDSTTIADIQKIMGGGVTSAFKEKTVGEWLKRKNPAKGVFENEVVETFTYSLAGYCVATYLLGVGDRHNDNVMLKNDGHLFHIDYGHILGNAEKWNGIKRDRAPFVLTPEFVYVMGGKKSEGFTKFCDVACDAYNVIRKYSSTFITLFTMMLSTDIPELRSEEDVYYLRTAFNTEMGDNDDDGDDADKAAKEFFRGLISQSLGTKMTRINNAIHIAVHPHINDAHDTNLK